MKNEHVLAVKKEAAESIIPKSGKGFIPISEFSSVNDFFQPKDVMIGSREWLEADENFLQVIPYSVVMSEGKVLAYSRTASGGENRLHGKWSCGFGGHVNVSDVSVCVEEEGVIDLEATIIDCAIREIEEEILTPRFEPLVKYSMDAVKGIILDMTNSVGRVHIGILIVNELNPSIKNEKGKLVSEDEGVTIEGFFSPDFLLSEAANEKFELEEWSKLALEFIGGRV